VEGALAYEGASVVGRTSSHRIAVRSVSEGGHPAELHSCGGVFRSELTVSFWSNFSGFLSLYVGRTWRFWTCISAWIWLLLYQVPLYFVLAVFHLMLSSYIDIYSKLVSPVYKNGGGGWFIQGHVDQKYLCTKMHVFVS
jgi:hypothetical protein